MTRSDIEAIFESNYPHELASPLIDNYWNASREYKKNNWQYFGNEVGQFIEISRRMIEYQLDKKYTPLEKKLANFNESVLVSWENHDASISEVYRIVIPRCLYSMYCLRNKRGMIHKNQITPNKMDANILLHNTKWVLAELFRMVSTKSFEETTSIIDSIMCKETSIIWDTGSCLRIMDTKMSSINKVLCLLYIKDSQKDNDLQNSVEYKNTTQFRRILKEMHSKKLIEYSSSICILSPLGEKQAEELLTAMTY